MGERKRKVAEKVLGPAVPGGPSCSPTQATLHVSWTPPQHLSPPRAPRMPESSQESKFHSRADFQLLEQKTPVSQDPSVAPLFLGSGVGLTQFQSALAPSPPKFHSAPYGGAPRGPLPRDSRDIRRYRGAPKGTK